MTKRSVVLAVGLPLAVLLLSLSQVWATGTSADPVLGRTVLSATGGQLAPASIGLTLVMGAALVALLTGGARIRTAAGILLALAAAGALALSTTALLGPAAALGRRAGELAGRTGGTVPVSAQLGPWAWLGVAAALVAAVASVAALLSARRWAGLSARFDRGAYPSTGRGQRRSAWDDLTDGHDPTRADDDERT